MLGRKPRVEPFAKLLPIILLQEPLVDGSHRTREKDTNLFHQNGLCSDQPYQGAHSRGFGHAPGLTGRDPRDLLSYLMAGDQDHGVGDRAKIEKNERRVSQVLGHLGENMI